MSLIFSEEDNLLRNSAREFVQKEALPAMAEQAAKHADGSQWDIALGLWPRLAELGFVGISTSEEAGGLGMGITQELIVMEELAPAGPLGTNLDAHNLSLRLLEYQGTDFMKEKWLKPAARGEIMLALAQSDPAGSMNFPDWSIRCEEDGDEVVLNGTKNFCSNSQGADVYMVAVKDYENGYPENFVIVPADTPGLEMGQMEEVGKTGCNTGTIYLNDVRVPKEYKFPSGDYGNAEWLALGYLDCAIVVNGYARAALEIAKEYVKNRVRDGKPLASLQAVAHRIVNCEMKIEQVRTLVYAAAELWDAGQPDLKLHSIAKIAAAECCSDVTKECCYLLGAYGMAPGSGTYELYCVAPAGWVGEAPNDFHRDLIAGLLGMPQASWLNDPVK